MASPVIVADAPEPFKVCNFIVLSSTHNLRSLDNAQRADKMAHYLRLGGAACYFRSHPDIESHGASGFPGVQQRIFPRRRCPVAIGGGLSREM
jgi:hypothetical protein